MSRRIFLDVGAHRGQTLEAVVAMPEFDKIVCFEPCSAMWPKLEEIADERTVIRPFGLWNKDGEFPIYQPGSKGAGLWVKDNGRGADETEDCLFVRASRWTKENLREGDVVFMKINCEGAECDIIDDLLDSKEFDRVTYAMVDFDVRKIGAMKHREVETRARLAPYEFPRVAYTKQVMIGDTHAKRITHWIEQVKAHA